MRGRGRFFVPRFYQTAEPVDAAPMGSAVLTNGGSVDAARAPGRQLVIQRGRHDQKVNAASFQGTLLALAGFRSYDPIRRQEPQWPRRPLAIGRRGLPLNPSRSAPGMSSTPSAQSHIRGYRTGGPQSSPSAGLPKSVDAHAAAAARPAKAGVSPKAARLAGTCLYSFVNRVLRAISA